MVTLTTPLSHQERSYQTAMSWRTVDGCWDSSSRGLNRGSFGILANGEGRPVGGSGGVDWYSAEIIFHRGGNGGSLWLCSFRKASGIC